METRLDARTAPISKLKQVSLIYDQNTISNNHTLRKLELNCLGRISMIDTPVTSSPAIIALEIGDAPRHRGNKLACTLRTPLSLY